MIQKNTYDIVNEPSSVVLGKLLEWALNVAPQLGLVVHSDRVKLSSQAITFLERVEPYLIATMEVSEWPGTKLIGEQHGILKRYRLTPEYIEVFVGAADRLYRWVNPGLPEDPHLLREDGSVMLGTVTQEEDAWMELSGHEFDSLVREVPWMSRALRQGRNFSGRQSRRPAQLCPVCRTVRGLFSRAYRTIRDLIPASAAFSSRVGAVKRANVAGGRVLRDAAADFAYSATTFAGIMSRIVEP